MSPPQEPDYSGTRGRLMSFLPDLNVAILENRTSNEEQIWTYRLAVPPPPAPRPPEVKGLSVTTADGGKAVLAWQPVPGAGGLAGYHVYRGQGDDRPWRTTWKRLTATPIRATTLSDAGLERGAIYSYYVTSVAQGGVEGAPSAKVRAQPAVVCDSRVDVLAPDQVVYSWQPLKAEDVVGYVVERAVLQPISGAQKIQTAGLYDSETPLAAMVEKAALSAFERLTPQPIQQTTLTDRVDLRKRVEVTEPYWRPWFPGGKGPEGAPNQYDMTKPGCPYTIYAYRVRAVNRLGIESGPSPYQMTVPNEVENLYSKEEGQGIRLRWEASPHPGIKGYYVFRIDAQYPTKVRLLTPEPIRETTFVDAGAGGQSKRYNVVVVDTLGQQGLPSHAVWAFRPWREHYAPWLPADGWPQ
jgi:hypothetical protein